MKVKQRLIWVTGQFVGFHRWVNAPSEVGFLQHWHRHVFKVKATLKVIHNDRDLEFFIVQEFLNQILGGLANKRIENSCEMFAERIGEALTIKYGDDVLHSVEVSEDGENGATLEFE